MYKIVFDFHYETHFYQAKIFKNDFFFIKCFKKGSNLRIQGFYLSFNFVCGDYEYSQKNFPKNISSFIDLLAYEQIHYLPPTVFSVEKLQQ